MSNSALVAGNQLRRHHNRHRVCARTCPMAFLSVKLSVPGGQRLAVVEEGGLEAVVAA
jgi:hypothetical protein